MRPCKNNDEAYFLSIYVICMQIVFVYCTNISEYFYDLIETHAIYFITCNVLWNFEGRKSQYSTHTIIFFCHILGHHRFIIEYNMHLRILFDDWINELSFRRTVYVVNQIKSSFTRMIFNLVSKNLSFWINWRNSCFGVCTAYYHTNLVILFKWRQPNLRTTNSYSIFGLFISCKNNFFVCSTFVRSNSHWRDLQM